MSLSTTELELLKQYLRIDHDEDELLERLYKRAKISLRNKVGPMNLANEDVKELHDQACALLVQHWNDNREAFRIGNASYEIPHSLDSLIRELRYCQPGVDTE